MYKLIDIIVCLDNIKKFGKICEDGNLELVTDINEATKFIENYNQELTYYLDNYRNKYVASNFISCTVPEVILNNPIKNILQEHVKSDKLEKYF